MNGKKILCSVFTCMALIGLLSKISFAASETGYSFRLPATGSLHTESVTKPTQDEVGYNYATYVGYDKTTLNCWVVTQASGERLTATASYSKPCTVSMYYDSDYAKAYWGHSVNMLIKTGPADFHQCDVQGRFRAS